MTFLSPHCPEGVEGRRSGNWKTLAHSEESCPWVVFFCPVCCEPMGLGSKGFYTVQRNGTVSPEVVCTGEGCTFQQVVVLEDWDKIYGYESHPMKEIR